ncbi:glycerophosphodiester phosphodiesterase family protein [uncultured Acetatifactor sp.]|uniref:glycerophosphodiester phosphodiesterase family protein n=1 Tax=uncultured Acetatifactor sp. TaxID=1671927 RepID=UPI0025A978D6|nr:glycerophosphodiester phosphodiesterase family protein [uncultured Acetatifactor sp.]
MKIWAHRGCSQMYPENTILAFEKAAAIEGLAGIELDIQLSRDGYMVVCHDERVDRTTDGIGEVRGFTLAELKGLRIEAGGGRTERIPTIEEVLDLLEPKFAGGFKLNIELKNSNFPYEGMEERIVELVQERGLQGNVIYSSFSALSLEKLRRIDPKAEIGMLDTKVSDCLFKLKGSCGANALHPFWRGIDLPAEQLRGYAVRAWLSGHLYPERPTGARLDLAALEGRGITDLFLNEPEVYC